MPDFTKPWCYYVDPFQKSREEGFIPSVVFEGEPGHHPMMGNGPCAQPWFWGKTIEEAKTICDEANAKMGLTKKQVDLIIASSMAAQNIQEAKRREWHGDKL